MRVLIALNYILATAMMLLGTTMLTLVVSRGAYHLSPGLLLGLLLVLAGISRLLLLWRRNGSGG